MKPFDVSSADPETAPILGRIRGRVVWTIVDQALASVTNLGTAVVAARTLDPKGFGAFGLAFALYLLVAGACRALVTEPLLSRYSHSAPARMGTAVRAATGAAAGLGVVSALVVAVTAAVVGGLSGRALAGLALVLPVLVLQDAWRYCFVASGQPAKAAANDGLWLVAQLVLAVPLLVFDAFGLLAVILWWGGGAAVAAAAGCVQARATPVVSSAWAWIGDHRELGGRYVAEFATASGAGQGTLLALGGLAGLAALGAVRAAQVFFGPINVAFGGMMLALVPEGVRLRDDPVRLRRLMGLSSLGLMGAGAAWLAVGLALPARLGEALFGDTWGGARDIMIPMGIGVLGGAAAAGGIVGLRALAAARASLRARLAGLPLAVAAPLLGAAAGARGFAVGLAVATWGGAVIWWHQFRRALAEAPEAPVLQADSAW